MTVLVTGGAGFIGYHLVRRLLADGHRVVSVDNLDAYYDVGLKEARLRDVTDAAPAGAYRFELCDIVEHERLCALMETERPQAVIHLAAQAGARHSLKDPFSYAHSNMTGFLSVLEACRHHPVDHLIYASSSSVYGMDSPVPYSTDARADQPVSLYAATKRSNELMAYTYAQLYAIPTTGLRFFTVYGPWGRPDMAYYAFADRILAGKPIRVFNGGVLSRDFTYVDDVIEGIVRLIPQAPTGAETVAHAQNGHGDGAIAAASHPNHTNGRDVPHCLYNIGRGEPVDLMEFIELLQEELGAKARLEMVPMQAGDVYTTFADTLALQRAVQYQPKVPLKEGIGRFVAWYREYVGVTT